MSTAEGGTAAEMVDWQLATGVARKLLRPGPAVSRAEADQVVAELRQFAADSEHHVREFTGLQATSATAPVVIVDRPGWVQANADGFRTVLQPLADKLREKAERTGGLSSAVGSRVTAIEAGALLAFLSSRVLGQFDPFYPSAARPGPARSDRSAAAGRAQRDARGVRAGRRTAGLQVVGVSARGDAPGAVHRGPVAAGPPAVGDRSVPGPGRAGRIGVRGDVP